MAESRRAAVTPAAPSSDKSASPPLTVTQLTAQIDRALRQSLPESLTVKGEVSNCSHAASGHLYFTLKDAGACIDCVMFRDDASRLKFEPDDGMELLATGGVRVFQQRGKYQLYVKRLSPLGQGALELAFQQLRAKLQAEGLFDPARKKALPRYPRRIVLVTSRATAALQDMLKVLRRFPAVSLMLYHVPVQGDGAAERIAAAIADLNRAGADVGGVDLILLGRGGGSLEDLWEFNEEIVARSIFASQIPIVTGIGHEVDVSIADLVADHHAHTPTEAAQVAVNQWRTAAQDVVAAAQRLGRAMDRTLGDAQKRLSATQRHEFFRRPMDLIDTRRQWLDDLQRSIRLASSERVRGLQRRVQSLSLRLEPHHPASLIMRLRSTVAQRELAMGRAMSALLGRLRERLFKDAAALGERHPRHALGLGRQRVETLSRRLDLAMVQSQARRTVRLNSLETHLNAVSPQRVLARGYTVTTFKKTGAVVRGPAELKPGQHLVTRFVDGTVESTVEDAHQPRLFEE